MMYESKVSITEEPWERINNAGKIRADIVVHRKALATAKKI
jgi:hypothetical protein